MEDSRAEKNYERTHTLEIRCLLLLRVQEQDCKVYPRDFFFFSFHGESAAPVKYMDSSKGNGKVVRVLYRVSKEDRWRCNGRSRRLVVCFCVAGRHTLGKGLVLARASFFAFEIRRLLPAIATGFRKENTRRQSTLPKGIPLRATKRRYAAKWMSTETRCIGNFFSLLFSPCLFLSSRKRVIHIL